MATKKQQGNVPGAVVHGAIGAVPLVGSGYEGYKAAKHATGSTGVGVGGSAAAIVVPFGGVAAGAYHGYNTPTHRSSHGGRDVK